MILFLTLDHIKHQFIGNPDWKELYKKHFPNEIKSPKEYLKNSYKILKDNGYTFEIYERMKSQKFKTVVRAGIFRYYGTDKQEDTLEFNWDSIHMVEQNLLIYAINYYEIDFTKLK